MACWAEHLDGSWLHHLRWLLSHSHAERWADDLPSQLRQVFRDDAIDRYFRCPCDTCRIYRERPSALENWAVRVREARKLFATCIIAGQPRLIFPLLRGNINDARFDSLVTSENLTQATRLSRTEASLLLSQKEAFFDGGRINLFSYLRWRGERPDVSEKNWLFDEMLALIAKLAILENEASRRVPSNATIGSLTIRDSRYRSEGDIPLITTGYANERVNVRSLGYLIFDLVWYIAGSALCVKELDVRRRPGVDWVKMIQMRELESDPLLGKALDPIWIMICPDSDFGLGENDFAAVLRYFRKVWPTHNYQPTIPDQDNQNSELNSNSSGPARNMKGTHYEELEAEKFRWIILRYARPGRPEKQCRLRVFKTADNKRVKLERYRFDNISVNDSNDPLQREVKVAETQFVPLYAYSEEVPCANFSIRFEHKVGSSEECAIPHVFRFQNIDGKSSTGNFQKATTKEANEYNNPDVLTFQTAVTGRLVEYDVAARQFAMTIRKRKLLNFGIHQQGERVVSGPGRIQIWRVLDRNALQKVQNDAADSVERGLQKFPLRVEIALFSRDMLVVIGVHSLLMAETLPDFTLKIDSIDPAPACRLRGRQLRTFPSPQPNNKTKRLSSTRGYQNGSGIQAPPGSNSASGNGASGNRNRNSAGSPGSASSLPGNPPGIPLLQEGSFVGGGGGGEKVDCEGLEVKFASESAIDKLREFLRERYFTGVI